MVHKTLYVLLGLITFHATIASGQDLYRASTTPLPIPSTGTLYGAYFTVSGLPQSALVTGMDVHFTGYHPNPPEFRVFFTDWLPNSGTWSTKIDLYSGLGPIDSDVDSTTALNWLPANNEWTIWGWDTNPATQGDGEITEWWFRMYFYCDSCPYIYDSRINNWFPGAAEDRDTSGYFEVFEFDVDIDADVLGENFPVRAKVMADGQAWEDWTPTWDVSWYAQEYQPWPYSQEDFFGSLSGPTDLNFWVELWNPANDIRYDKFPWIIQGGPIPVEPDFPDLRSAWITNLQYGIDADADSYYETFQFAIAIDADCPACTQWVAAKIFSVSTVPNIEFQTPAWEISGTQIDSNRIWFSELDFTGFQGNTNLYFIVELWNAGFTRFYRQDIVLQSIKADNNVLPEIVDVAGHARYLDKDNDSLPIRYAQVKITDWDLPVFYYWTSTDSLGYYSLTIPNDPDGDLTGADIEVQVFSVGEGDVNPIPGQNHDMIEVKDTSGSLYGQPSTISADNTNPWLTVDLTAPNMDTLDGAFCVYDAGVEGYLRSYEYFSPPWNPLSLPKLTIRWPDTATYYSNNFNQIRAERGERWDRDVILHEYGHFLADIRHFADADVGTTGDHTWLADLRHFPDSSIRTEEQARNLAFREAWASWFAIAVQYDRTGSTILYNIRNRDDLPGSYQYEDQLDLERANLLLLRPGQYCEGMNAGLLWDMYDEVQSPGVDANDHLALGSDEIWDVLSLISNTLRPDEITLFWTKWFADFPTIPGYFVDYNRDVTNEFLDHQMTFVAQRVVDHIPVMSATDVPLYHQVSWNSSLNAVTYDVYEYVGMNDRVLWGSGPDTFLQVSHQQNLADYLWEVVAKDSNHAEAESYTWMFTTGACDCPHQGDLDGDGFVDSIDLSLLIDAIFFGGDDPRDPYCPRSRGDHNDDGFTDSIDLTLIIDHIFFAGALPVDPCM